MDDTKPWYLSRTVWGALVAIADTALQIVGAIGGLLALYGRLSAQKIIS